MGIGMMLLDQGISNARQLKLGLGTEASVKGVGLYRKRGFEEVGVWKVGGFELPVMRLAS